MYRWERPSKPKERIVKIRLPDYKPSDRQSKFHASDCFETLYGGAAGGGKTAALCAEAVTAAIEDSDTHIYIFRRSLRELKQSTYVEIMSQIARYQNLADAKKATLENGKKLTINYNSQESVFKFSNGSFIQLAYLDTIADRYLYQSAEIHVLLIDELTHFLQDDYEYLKTRVRSKDARRLRVMASTNPGNVGHGWVKERFIRSKDPNVHYKPEKAYHDPKTGMSRIFIPAKVTDHPSDIFRANYLRVLDAIPDEQLRKALRDGDWDVFEGQVYTEWDVDTDVIRELPVDLDLCEKYIGFDWGYNDWGCAVWIARAPENEQGIRRLYAYREIYERHKTPSWWADQIANITRDEPVEFMILPHDCFSHLGGNQTIARTFSDHGLTYVRADSLSHRAKLHRQALLHQLLEKAPDELPYFQAHINCANVIRTIPDLPYSNTKPEEISEKSEDHAFDALTYGLMVVTDGESWIYNPDGTPRPSGRESFLVSDTSGPTYDIHRAILNNDEGERDWRYT